jgi:cell division septation protein DedD
MIQNQETKSFQVDYRHLAFFFIGAVAVCAVFFALGFVVGRAQTPETALKDPGSPKGATDKDFVEAAADANTQAAAKEGATALSDNSPGGSRPPSAGDYRKELDYYSTLKDQKINQSFHLESADAQKSWPASDKRSADATVPARASAKPKVPVSGSLRSLQVAALKSSADAEKLAKVLRAKGYPVFTVNTSKQDANKLIRVQVGPYTSDAEAARTKARLAMDGYSVITKR